MNPAPSSCNEVVPPSGMDTGLELELLTLPFLLQHRFLPCENKSKAVEKVKSDFNKVSLGSSKEGGRNATPVCSPKAEGGAVLHLECGNLANRVTSSAS